jgi:trans-aconitate 2-methyltransferase
MALNQRKKMNEWNPQLYMKFKNERTQPSIDLTSRIDADNPNFIVDVGCGPGNSTNVLSNRWPRAEILGIDNSKEMIQKATDEYPEAEWMVSDIFDYYPTKKIDILFSNAVIQWIPNHEKLFNKFYEMLSNEGILANTRGLYTYAKNLDHPGYRCLPVLHSGLLQTSPRENALAFG